MNSIIYCKKKYFNFYVHKYVSFSFRFKNITHLYCNRAEWLKNKILNGYIPQVYILKFTFLL